MKNLVKRIKRYFALKKAEKELSKAIAKAESLYKSGNRRYYVIPDTNHHLRVFSWSELKKMRKQGLFSTNAKEPDFIRESFYFTPSRIDASHMKPEVKIRKKKAWLNYYELYRM